jgi:hypothetical protein
MRLVGAKRSKAALVALVCWLLRDKAKYRDALEEITLIHRDAVTMHTTTLKCVHIARKALEGVER